MSGQLDVLNVGSGHIEVRFDQADTIEMERARRMITDCLRRGYAIFVEVDGALAPVREFDEARGVYIVSDVPTVATSEAEPAPVRLKAAADADLDDGPPLGSPKSACAKCQRPRHRGRCKREVPMEKARATAIGRSAGG